MIPRAPHDDDRQQGVGLPGPAPPPIDSQEALGSGPLRVVRRGWVSWLTHPPQGTARISVESHAFGALPMSLAEGDPVPRESTPGELLAIAHGTFMAWALSEVLAGLGRPADELVVEASATFAGHVEERELVRVDLHVQGRVPGIDQPAFHEAVEAARDRYPRVCGVRENIPGSLEAVLAPSSERR